VQTENKTGQLGVPLSAAMKDAHFREYSKNKTMHVCSQKEMSGQGRNSYILKLIHEYCR